MDVSGKIGLGMRFSGMKWEWPPEGLLKTSLPRRDSGRI